MALRLNIDYDDAGICYDATGLGVAAHPPGIAFGDLIYTGLTGSLAGVNGLTIRQVSEIANVLLGGGAEPYDIADFDRFLGETNNAFVGGFAINNTSSASMPTSSCPKSPGRYPSRPAWPWCTRAWA